MKKILTNNIGMKIIAILIALIGWLVIINIDDPTITKTISGISVDMENESMISDAGKCYEVESGDEVSVVVKGKKSVVDGLGASDFKAVADLSKYSITNAVPVEVSTIKNFGSNLDIIEGKNNTLMISLENYITKQFTLQAKLKGKVASGYYISTSEISSSPNRIEVSCPESVMNKISSVKYTVDVTDANEQFSSICEPVAYDMDGNEINSDKITFAINNINVSGTPLYKAKIPVEIETSGKEKEGYKITKVSGSVDQITVVCSDKSILDKIDKAVIEVNCDGITETLKQNMEIGSFLPDGVKIISKETTTEVNIKVEKLEVKDIAFNADDVKFSNIMNDIIYDYSKDITMYVTVRGLSSDLENITIDKLSPSIDLSLLRMGKQNVKISFGQVDGIEILDTPSLKVTLEKKPDTNVTQPTDNNTDNSDKTDNSAKKDNNTSDEEGAQSSATPDDTKSIGDN